ncbi:unnamed protein product, partial [Urochloa humidicola]
VGPKWETWVHTTVSSPLSPSRYFFFWFSDGTPGAPRPLLPIDSSIAPLPGQAAEGRRRPEAPSSSQYGFACRWLRLNGQSAADLRRRCHLGATPPACGTLTAGARKSCRWIEYRFVREAVLLGGILYFDSHALQYRADPRFGDAVAQGYEDFGHSQELDSQEFAEGTGGISPCTDPAVQRRGRSRDLAGAEVGTSGHPLAVVTMHLHFGAM